jgi:hypothetical protein
LSGARHLLIKGRDAGGSSEAGEATSNADPPGVGLPQGGLTPRSGWLRGSRSGSSRRRSSRRKLRARESSDFRVLVSNVGCRGRCEVSSRRFQGEPRGEPRRRRVGRLGSSFWTRRAGARRSIRVRSLCARNEQLLQTSSAEPQGSASIRRKASWAGCMAALNKQLYCVSWRGGGRRVLHRKVWRAESE